MKHIITFALTAISVVATAQQKNDLQKENLHGNIKSVRETAYEVTYNDAGKLDKGEIKEFIFDNSLKKFNEQGNITEEIWYDFENIQDSKRTNTQYNAKGLPTEALIEEKDGSSIKVSLKYDEKGNLLEEIFHRKEGQEKFSYKYDQKGNRIEHTAYDIKYSYQYNDKGQVIEENIHDEMDKISTKTIIKYDKKGNFIKKTAHYLDVSTKENYTYQYTYDQKGNWVKRIEYKDKNPIQITERVIEYY